MSVFGPGALAQPAADLPNVVVVLDSSHSMWGQIDGINKVVSARDTVTEIAKRYGDKVLLGLVAYGHRPSAGCKDVEVVLKPAAPNVKKVTEVVNGLTPNGSTPTAEALAAAAKAVEGSSRRTAVILIADGTDNCRGDPCAAAGRLKSEQPGLSFHVVGFDRDAKRSLKPLSCVAEKGGGSYRTAANETELKQAVTAVIDGFLTPAATPAPKPQPRGPVAAAPEPLTTAALRPASYDAPPPPTPAPNRESEPAPAAKPVTPATAEARAEQPNTPVPVLLGARVTESGPPIGSGLVWRVFDARPGKDGRYKLIGTHREAAPATALPPGDYLINAAYGLSNLTKKISVHSGQSVQEVFILNTGGLRLGAALANGQSIPPNLVRYDIYEDETDQFGNREKVLDNAKPGVVIRLNAGAYHVVSVYGDANAIVRADVAVEPGRLTDATINHSAAKVTFRLVQKAGGEALADAQWSVLTPGGDVVKESAGALPTHILAAGEYTVLARYNGATYSQEFKVDTGEARQIEVMMTR